MICRPRSKVLAVEFGVWSSEQSLIRGNDKVKARAKGAIRGLDDPRLICMIDFHGRSIQHGHPNCVHAGVACGHLTHGKVMGPLVFL